MVRTRRTHLATLLLIGALLVPLTALADTEGEEEIVCPITGQVPITAEMRDEVRALGIKDSQTCWDPKDKHVGLSAAQAKQYLRSILCANVRDNYGGEGPDATISKLNAGFASCAATFLKAANARMQGAMPLLNGGTAPVCINEGFRTQAKQMEYWIRYKDTSKACDPTTRVCEHTKGLAIDVNTLPDSNYPILWDIGKRYGVDFYLGWKDKFHFRAVNTSCESTGQLFDLNTPVGGSAPTGAGIIPPNTYDFPPQGVAPAANPYTTFAQQFGQLLGPLTQSLVQPNTLGAQPVSNPSIPLASPLTPINNPLTGSQSTSQPANTITNPLSTPGGSNPISIPVSGSVPTSSTLTITNPLSAGGSGTKSSNLSPLATIEKLIGLYPGGSTPTGTSLSPAQINDDLENTSTDTELSTISESTTQSFIPQTFTSSDLRYSPRTQPLPTQTTQASGFSALLSQLRTGLLTLLNTPLVPRTGAEIGVWTPLPPSYDR